MSSSLPPFTITPPLLNSSNPWATTASDLLAVYQSPYTGAVTTRTSLLKGFTQHPNTHQYTFFSTTTSSSTSVITPSETGEGRGSIVPGESSSLNTLGYSPFPLSTYLSILEEFASTGKLERERVKPFIVSVTGSSSEVAECYLLISSLARKALPGLELLMEINLSCPNIVDKPPPAYDGAELHSYISAIAAAKAENRGIDIHVGIKTPPYTYHDQFVTLVQSLESSPSFSDLHPISFITATNTLGNCLVLSPSTSSASASYISTLGSASGTGIGGMAGEALHPLSLGNVKTIRALLDQSERPEVRRIQIIGIGGVGDADGWKRMRSVGASAVGVGTAFGRKGVQVFEEIAGGVEGKEFEFKSFGHV